MGVRYAGTGVMLVLLTVVASAFANNPLSSDPVAPTKSSKVKNAPFSADVITNYDRTLDKGGHIRRESRGKIFRDSQGRIRTESEPTGAQSEADKYEHVTITDPVKQVIIYLNARNKTATVFPFGDAVPSAPVAKQTKPKNKTKVRFGGQPGGLGGDLGVPNIPAGQANVPSPQPVQTQDESPPKIDGAVFSNASGATIVPLGTKMIAGLNASGTRTTRTFNAGTIGNDKPIVSISDTWISTDLKVAILTETDDGQAGHSTMKMVNIFRAEPTAALFQIPADYAVRMDTPTTSAKR